VLPLWEAPKNILCALYGLLWLINRVRTRDFGGRWDGWDTLIAIWLASGFVVAAGAAIHYSEWRGAMDLVRYGAVLWAVKRARYGEPELRWVFLALVASGVVGLAMGYWDVLVTHKRIWLELQSVGQVNHSSVYLAILLGATAGCTAAYWRDMNGAARAVAAFVCALFGVSLIYMSSRGAAGAEAVFLLVLALVWLRRSRRAAFTVVVALAVAVGGSVALKFGFVQKEAAQEQSAAGILSWRDRIWRMAWEEWKLHPWFGVGMDNYSRIKVEDFAAEQAAQHHPVDRDRFLDAPHAHSLLFNTLAERGIVGALALAAVLLAWASSLLRHLPRNASPPVVWAVWSSAASAWVITVVAGLANTTLHHEHGILACLMLGAWLGVLRAGARRPGAAADAMPAEEPPYIATA